MGKRPWIIFTVAILGLFYYFIYSSSSVSWAKHQISFGLGNSWFNNKSVEQQEKDSNNPVYKPKKLLTIFTTFKDVPDRNFIQNNTIINWASLGDSIQPMFFANLSIPSPLTSYALERGWVGLPLQRTNSFGTPFLKDMYRRATSYTDSHFYGFCNGDILFDETLVRTLEGVLDTVEVLSYTTLVIGRRTNVDMKDAYDILGRHNASLLSDLAKSKGRLFSSDAEDFFFMSYPGGFPWHTIKEVVIGRPAYDNYLVGQALHGNISVIDATKTLLAFHQTGSDGIRAGSLNKDGNYNKRVIGHYRYTSGTTGGAQYQTERDFRGKVFLIKRNRPKPKPKSKPNTLPKPPVKKT